ncbi:MAG: Uma2 family endonuclease [Bacteroidia bacterium]
MGYTVENDKLIKVNEPDLSGTYTAGDYITWKFEEMVELVRGKIFRMTGPGFNHQDLVGRLHLIFGNSLKGNPCRVVLSPVDVYLDAPQNDYRKAKNVFQPDLCIVCAFSKIRKFGIVGAPDFVIEILSPSTQKKDMTLKFEEYQKYGVKEYWIVNPMEKWVSVNYLNDSGKYYSWPPKAAGENISPQQFPEVEVELDALFEGLLE